MAVAALSTSAIALATAPAPSPAPATTTGEASEKFAQLVSRAKPDGQAQQGEAKAKTAEDETASADAPAEEAVATSEGETEEARTDKVDLLAELEAIFAAAAQTGVTPPPPAAAPAALTVSTDPAAPTISVSPDSITPDITNVAKAATVVSSLATAVSSSIATQAPPADSFAAKLSNLAPPTDPAATTERPALPSSPAAAGPAADAPATVALRRDIATIVASLKAAFHPTETGGGKPIVAPAPAAPAQAAIEAVPPAVPVPAPATASAAAPIALAATPAFAMPAKGAVAPVLVNHEAPTEEAVIVSPLQGEASDDVPTPVAPNPGPAVAIDTSAQAAAARPAVIAAPAAPLTDTPVPHAAEEPTADAVSAMATPPLSAAPAVTTNVMPTSVTEAPVTDAAATAIAPNHAEQSVVRHLDLARDTQWLDQLARDIHQAAAQQSNLKFQLNPEHLGALTIEIANSLAGTTIKLTAETDQARAIIADAQPRLLAEVRAQGLRVAESHVDLNQQGGGGSTFAQGQQRQSSENSKPFAPTQTVSRDEAGDSAPRENGELYA